MGVNSIETGVPRPRTGIPQDKIVTALDEAVRYAADQYNRHGSVPGERATNFGAHKLESFGLAPNQAREAMFRRAADLRHESRVPPLRHR